MKRDNYFAMWFWSNCDSIVLFGLLLLIVFLLLIGLAK